ncbi:MAG: fumarate hydratase [Thermoplasmata archaeon]
MTDFAGMLADALGRAVIVMPEGLIAVLRNAYERETSALARMHLRSILDNIELADREYLPVCEDTGIQTIFVDAGREFSHLGELLKAIPEAVERATVSGPLRPNTVDPFTGRNFGNNLGPNSPAITLTMLDGDCATVHLLPKGGGSEQLSALWMLPPADGIAGLKREVLSHVQKAGGRACPPVILGIGIGGSADTCLKLAKRSLLRPLGAPSPDPHAAALEKELLDAVNELGIGPMGMGGNCTALAVNVESAPRHPATFPVGLVMQCWCHRHVTIRLDRDGKVLE